jgi:MFS family permease
MVHGWNLHSSRLLPYSDHVAYITYFQIVILVYAIPLHKRPKFQGFFGAVFGVSSVAGPLVGGAFTTKVTWRWCFYINLPFGAVVTAFIIFLLQIPNRPNTNIPLKDKLRQLNALGLLALIPGVVCLLLALQWGGVTYPVSSPPAFYVET